MLITVDPADPRPIYAQIVDEVRRALVVGTLLPDDPLPSTRQLAADLRVNPNTVAQAYQELERQNVVYVRRGQGTFARRLVFASTDRSALAAKVAMRAIQDAHRNGLEVGELLAAIKQSGAKKPHTASEPGKRRAGS